MLSTYRLPGMMPEEKIIKVYRKNIFVLFKKIILFLVLIILPAIVAFIMINYIFPDIIYNELAYPIFLVILNSYYLFLWLFFFFSFIDYYLDIWIITNERIIDIEQNGFFSRVIAEQRLYRIQDVASEVSGFFETVLKFGNVFVQTAGAKQRFIFEDVSNPDEVRDMIIKLVEKSKKNHPDLVKKD